MPHKELLIFEVAGSFFSVPLDYVEEVVPATAVTEIPNSPSFLLGLAAIRGKVVSVIDAARRYGIGPALNSHFLICYVRGNLTAVAIGRPIVAGALPVRKMEGVAAQKLQEQSRLDEKFIKSAYELLEKKDEKSEFMPAGLHFLEVDIDFFVSAEMASMVAEA